MPPDSPPDSDSRLPPGLAHAPSDIAQPGSDLHRASHDPLTGLAGRELFHERLHSLIRHTAPEREALAIVFMTMAGLAAIRERHGDRAGDAAVVEFAHRIREAARRVDVCARLGGDAFAVILPHVSNRPVAARVEQRLCEAVDHPFSFEGETFALAARSGLALYPDDGNDSAALLEYADRALSEAARARRPGP